MTILNDIYEKSLAIYDEISKNGTIDSSKTADYGARTPRIADMLQKELLKASDYSKKYEIACSPIDNALGKTTGFDIQEFKGTDVSYECPYSVYAYCFETDGEGIAYIEDYNGAWNILTTINMTLPSNGFTQYKGVLTPTTGATKSRIRFTGTYYYRTVNRALFNVRLQLSRVPNYTPWVKVALPSDVKEITQVITEFPDRQYTKDTMYKQEIDGNTQQLYVNYYYVGKLRVQYKAIPSTLTSLTDTLDLDEITLQCLVYGLAKWFAISEQNKFVAEYCEKKFQELKIDSRARQPATIEQIIDIYRVGDQI